MKFFAVELDFYEERISSEISCSLSVAKPQWIIIPMNEIGIATAILITLT